MATTHIESNENDIAKTVLMPGDPKRCQYIAENFLSKAKLVNRVRGMIAYTGYYKNKLITIFPSGMGNPSMGIYSYELYKSYNVDNIIRIGSCGGYISDLKLQDIVLVDNSISESTYALLLDNYKEKSIASNNELNMLIQDTAKEHNITIRKGNIYCSDVFYEQNNSYIEVVNKYNVLGVEMETFALFNNARVLNKKASSLLTVSNSFCYSDELSSEEREKFLNNMIFLALETSLKL